MSRVPVHTYVVSLDGPASGEHQVPAAPIGPGRYRFATWFDAADPRRRRPSWPGGRGSQEEAIAAAWESVLRAETVGRIGSVDVRVGGGPTTVREFVAARRPFG